MLSVVFMGTTPAMGSIRSSLLQQKGKQAHCKTICKQLHNIHHVLNLAEAFLTCLTGMYDGLKHICASRSADQKVGLAPRIACGVASSFTGQMLAFPFEAISRRMQAGPDGQT